MLKLKRLTELRVRVILKALNNMERISFFIRENIRLLLGLAVVIFFSILLFSFIIGRSELTQVTVNGNKFNVELAKTETEKQIGLSKTNRLSDNEGMLFVFTRPDYYSFWMKEMKFPIDIIYINGNRVVSVVKNALPPSETNGNLSVYQPKDKSDKVLEVNAGLAEKYNIKEGSIVDINNL